MKTGRAASASSRARGRRGAVEPPALRPGDRIGVVAPSGPIRPEALDAGLEALRRRGYEVREAAHLRDRQAYLAGSDRDRLADLNAMLRDRSLRALWCARGGYGSARIVEGVDFAALRRHPKALIGYSDATVLQAAAWRLLKLSSFYGPNVSDLGDESRYDPRSLWGLLEAGARGGVDLPLGDAQIVRGGRAEGTLVGGCLSLLSTLVGTPWAVGEKGAILFWEDVNEEPYRIDRMLGHLRQAGAFERMGAMIVGQPVGCVPKDPANDVPLADIVRRHLGAARIPVVIGIPAGHAPGKMTLPLGRLVRLDTARRRLTVVPR